MKALKKPLNLIIIVVLAVTAAVFAYLYFKAEADKSAKQSDSSHFVTYSEDVNNRCTWKDGQMFGSTLAAQKLISVQIEQEDESVYLAGAAEDGTCTRKVNE